MEINNHETLVRLIRSLPEEEAIKTIKKYTDIVAEDYVNRTWERARKLIRFINRFRKLELKKHILEMDEYSAMISVVSFTRYFAALEDLLREYNEKGSLEVKACVNDVNELMYQLLDDKIKIDRRSIFQKD